MHVVGIIYVIIHILSIFMMKKSESLFNYNFKKEVFGKSNSQSSGSFDFYALRFKNCLIPSNLFQLVVKKSQDLKTHRLQPLSFLSDSWNLLCYDFCRLMLYSINIQLTMFQAKIKALITIIVKKFLATRVLALARKARMPMEMTTRRLKE